MKNKRTVVSDFYLVRFAIAYTNSASPLSLSPSSLFFIINVWKANKEILFSHAKKGVSTGDSGAGKLGLVSREIDVGHCLDNEGVLIVKWEASYERRYIYMEDNSTNCE